MIIMDKLKQLLSMLNAESTAETIQKTFSEIADILLFHSYIRTEYGNYRLLEIEFYFKNKNHMDDVTIKRKEKEGMWWLHEYGVDLSFNSDDTNKNDEDNYYGGILIRSMVSLNNDSQSDKTWFFGPKNCCWELFYSDALDHSAAPRIIMNEDKTIFPGKIATTRRYITGKTRKIDGDYRFYVNLGDSSFTVESKYKKASPWK